MGIIIYDSADVRENLLPITYTRPVGAIRMGLCTMAERWQAFLPGEYGWHTQDYLTELFPPLDHTDETTLYIAGNVIATRELAAAVAALRPGETLRKGTAEIARRGNGGTDIHFDGDVILIEHVYDIFGKNAEVLRLDFERVTAGRTSCPIDPTNTVLGDRSLVFIEEGATVEASTLNTRQGPIYIGKDATVMEGCRLRGPIAMCEHSQANMGTLLYGATTLGPWCKVGGEINNVVMLGYANKAHDGFLGNAVIGEWCNLGAGCTASNLKNTYGSIKLWSIAEDRFIKTGLQFCGLIMGDHSKAGINTMFNTATMVGVGVNFYGPGFPRTYLPSFTQGSTAGMHDMDMDAFFETASKVMARRDISLTEIDKEILLTLRQRLFDVS